MKKIKKKQFSPIYLFYGTESYLVEDLKQQILSKGLTEEERDTNVSIYDLEDVSIQEVVADAETYPFFGERKIIIVNNPMFLKAKPDKTSVEHDVEVLQSYLLHPAEYSIIVFIAAYEKIDERKKITKLLKKQSEVVACEPIKEWDLGKWIDDIVRSLKVVMDDPVKEKLVQEIGTNLLMLKSEIEKMAIYVGEDQHITIETAEQLLSHNTNTSGLKLVDAVINKDLSSAIQIYKDLEKMNEDPIALVALLSSQFRTIYHVKILKQKGYGQQQMAQQLRVHPYVVKMSASREKNFSVNELKEIFHIFTDTDASIKRGRIEKSLAFELLLYQLINRKATAIQR
ncbi:DNA polymerase III subunit delta [Aquibacillus kalidii]|uniref:DNA polymerase III subunit delta n=1 Tax=Aquibacillus kalidii TaxID=2762597 RepID=UPI001C99E6DE|nr:DNA polymerase III subunit delta [Aquibacillus kalidii]